MLLAWIALSRSATTWVDAKALVLTSSVVVLLAWGGIAALGWRARRARPRARAVRARAARRALALCPGAIGGVLASDVAQYHSSNLAPTARYEELASIDERFAGRGPALFDDFDEYSMYVLRDARRRRSRLRLPAARAGARSPAATAGRSSSTAPRRRAGRLPADRHAPRPQRIAAAGRLRAWRGRAATTRCGRAAPAPCRRLAHVASARGAPLACARVRHAGGHRRTPPRARRRAGAAARARATSHAPRPRRAGDASARGFAMHRAGTLSARFSRAACRRLAAVAAGPVHADRRRRRRRAPARLDRAVSSRATRSCPTPLRRSPCAWRPARTAWRHARGLQRGAGQRRRGGARRRLSHARRHARARAAHAAAARAPALCARRYAWVELVRADAASIAQRYENR